MPSLTDRQRIELAIPAYLLFALTGAPDVFIPTGPDLATQAGADIEDLRQNLRIASLEPFADLMPSRQQALMRRLERVKRQMTADWHEHGALSLMLMLWHFLDDLTHRQILILGEGSAMDHALRKLMPMCEYGVERLGSRSVPEEQARIFSRTPPVGGPVPLMTIGIIMSE